MYGGYAGGYEMERQESPVMRVVYFGAPALIGGIGADQGYRLLSNVIPLDMSKRTSRVLLGTATSLVAGLVVGGLWSPDRETQEEKGTLAFLGGMASVIMRESMG